MSTQAADLPLLTRPDPEHVSVCMVLPNGNLTEKLPLKINELVQYDDRNKASLLPDWEKSVLTRAFDSLRVFLDLHDVDPDYAHLETLQALFTPPDGPTTLHLDTLSLLYVDPDQYSTPIYKSSFAQHFTWLRSDADLLTLDIRIKLIGRAQRILTEACNPAVNISISSPHNTPEMMEKISGLLQSFMLAQTQLSSLNSSSISTPVTCNTTPTLQISTDGTTNFTPASTSPPALSSNTQIMFRAPDGTTQYSKPLDEDPFVTNETTTNQLSVTTQLPLVPDPSPSRDRSQTQETTTDLAPQQPTAPPNLPQSSAPQQAFFQGRPVNVNFTTPPSTLRTVATSSFAPPTATATTATPPGSTDLLDPTQPGSPAWDTFDRDAHSHDGISPAAVKKKKKSKERASLLHSTTWTHARFDLDKIDEALDLDTGLFLPWDAPRPDHGRIRNFALYMPSLHLDQKVFLSSFNSGLAAVGFSRFDPKNLRQFQDAFPIFGPDDVSNYLDWHDSVVLHGITFGVFVPPVHTLRDCNPLGIWFELLPLHVQNDAQNHFRFLLTGCIRGKLHPSLRQEHPDIYNIIQKRKSDGYLLLYDLALHCGQHPLLCHHGSFAMHPIQDSDMTLSQYVDHWLHFIRRQILDGVIFSDRFFHEQFLFNMHASVRSRLGPYLHNKVVSVPLGTPLPPSLAPDCLVSHLTQHVKHLNVKVLLAKTPRQLSSPSAPSAHNHVRALQLPAPQEPEMATLMIAALRTPGPCILCRSPEHKFAQCPSLAALKDEPYFCQLLTRTLQRMHPSPASNPRSNRRSDPPRPPSRVPRPQVRQLTSSDDPVVSTAPLPALESGEGSFDPSTSEPMHDFGEGTSPSFNDSPDFR
jgi:hypothetical protein